MRIGNISYTTSRFSNPAFGRKKTKAELEFETLKDKIEKEILKTETKRNVADWEYAINSSTRNKRKIQSENKKAKQFYNNNHRISNALAKLEKSGEIKDSKLSQQLDYLIELFNITPKKNTDWLDLYKRELEISKKNNSFQIKIDGRPVSEAEVINMEHTELNPEKRKKLYAAGISAGDNIADDLIELIKRRNDFAQSKGYKTFFEYEIAQDCDYPISDLKNWMQEVYKNIKNQNKADKKSEIEQLAEVFGISPEDIREYHRRYILDDDCIKKATENIESVEQTIALCKDAYKGMGFDLDKLSIIMDLFPRKNKSPSNMCYNIVPGMDSRIIANLTNDYNDIFYLIHELGHAVHNMNVDKSLRYMDKNPNSVPSEAFSMMMEDTILAENIAQNPSNTNLAKSLKQYRIREIIRDIFRTEFEMELYKNPYQDPRELWHKLSMKYNCTNPNEKLNNEWATIHHYTEDPAYMSLYFLAELYKVQLYKTLTKKFGPITKNPETAKYLRSHFFRYGSSIPDDRIVKISTGKYLSPKDFIKDTK